MTHRMLPPSAIRAPFSSCGSKSQKCAKGVYLADLAKYLEFRAEAARREIKGLNE
ncbi:MAG: hypothetical protein EOR78_02200 [Mesorhizobium sp.]|nr:MAG: hypothetical protein EOR49_00645 [Mesorhizobium sp.]RWK73093.1 MAG: hypothetical protein EOR45_34130 [Mesorhizobium sp.]RWM53969.1 MAG: hypothetical protein EOR76_01290 [Mesorhizobium sp.]RWM60911.1 MAG: hypothetical protein EOR78_02200 [Mesorhizobium sp.]RWM62550.1 MAG: hypothetical protein EOR79_00230 [Mesorhizobium sp.]